MNALEILDDDHRRRVLRRLQIEREERYRFYGEIARYAAETTVAMYALAKLADCLAPVIVNAYR
jgi:hypothetical protein